MIPESDQVRIARIKANERIEREKERQKSKRKHDLYEALPFIIAFGGFILMGIVFALTGVE